MKKINYKGRCEKRKVSKCEDICRTYSKIQSAMVDMLENNDDAVSFECNVRLKGVAEDLYSKVKRRGRGSRKTLPPLHF